MTRLPNCAHLFLGVYCIFILEMSDGDVRDEGLLDVEDLTKEDDFPDLEEGFSSDEDESDTSSETSDSEDGDENEEDDPTSKTWEAFEGLDDADEEQSPLTSTASSPSANVR